MTATLAADIIIVGAGIIGAACCYSFSQQGYRVILVDDKQQGASYAGMGHLVCMDDSPAELQLSHYSLQHWQPLLRQLPASCAWRNCGTLWLAEHQDELTIAIKKQQQLADYGMTSELLNRQQLRQYEPLLTQQLAGGLRVANEGIVYAPNVVRWLITNSHANSQVVVGKAIALEEKTVVLQNRQRLTAPYILLANGLGATALVDDIPLIAKKGQLAITDRYPLAVHHQLVELGYGASAHATSGSSVAFNVQPRPTGQLLIGSSRQFATNDVSIDLPLLQKMLQRALHFLPTIKQMNIVRCWAGIRVATPDGLPVLGPHPRHDGVWLALGHEGLGVTTAPGSAQLLLALLEGKTPAIDSSAFRADRFFSPIAASFKEQTDDQIVH